MATLGVIFLLLVVYQLKHLLADYLLQGRYMLGKFQDGWAFVLPLLAHVGVHAVLTFGIALACTHSVVDALLLAQLDASVHFIMDRLKAGKKYLGRFKPLTGPDYVTLSGIATRSCPPPPFDAEFDEARARLRGNTFFWWSLGFDQMVHHLTHYWIIYLMLIAMGLI